MRGWATAISQAARWCRGRQMPAEQHVQSLSRVAALLEPSTVHGLDLPLLHPHRVRVDPQGAPKYRSCRSDAARQRSQESPRPQPRSPDPEAVHVQTEHRWRDSGDRGASQGTLVCLIELAHVDTLGRRPLRLATPKTMTPPLFAIAATSLGKSACGKPFAGGSSDFQSRSLVSATPAATAASRSSSVRGPGATPSARWSAVKLMIEGYDRPTTGTVGYRRRSTGLPASRTGGCKVDPPL